MGRCLGSTIGRIQINQTNRMKIVRLLAITLCATALLFTGCKTCCKENCPKAKASCGMECCKTAGTDCAHCPKCSPKK